MKNEYLSNVSLCKFIQRYFSINVRLKKMWQFTGHENNKL
jgi:hypothetical protein